MGSKTKVDIYFLLYDVLFVVCVLGLIYSDII